MGTVLLRQGQCRTSKFFFIYQNINCQVNLALVHASVAPDKAAV